MVVSVSIEALSVRLSVKKPYGESVRRLTDVLIQSGDLAEDSTPEMGEEEEAKHEPRRGQHTAG